MGGFWRWGRPTPRGGVDSGTQPSRPE
jgi:hypothetical protein